MSLFLALGVLDISEVRVRLVEYLHAVFSLIQHKYGSETSYSAVHGFWRAKDAAELANGPIGCVEVARVGCLFAWNFGQLYLRRRRHDAALVTRS